MKVYFHLGTHLKCAGTVTFRLMPYLEPNQKYFCKNSSRLLAVNFIRKKSPTINVRLFSKKATDACKKRNKWFYMILHNFIWFYILSSFTDIKKTLHYKVYRVNIIKETFIFYALLHDVCFLRWIKFCSGCSKQAFFI